MNKWEYTILVTSEDVKDELKNLGEEGWEVFEIIRDEELDNLDPEFIKIYAKRPIE